MYCSVPHGGAIKTTSRPSGRQEAWGKLDGDEVFALIACCILGGRFIFHWYGALLGVTPLAASFLQRLVLALVPLGCLVLVQFVLSRWSAHEVREGGEYDFLFVAGGVAWLGFAATLARVIGVSARDDAIQARNPAGVIALCGVMIGATLCYAGANIGEGATIWMTFNPAVLATAVWFALWLALELTTAAADAVSIDRDLASSIRLAGFLISSGLVLGRAVAGDWHSWEQTVDDFITQGWPAAPFMLVAVLLQILWRPTPTTPRHPIVRRGAVPAAILVCAAVLYVLWLGPFEHGTKGG